MSKKRRGNCYYTCEALYHLLGGTKSPWRPAYMYWEGGTHWILHNCSYSEAAEILDPTASQFKNPPSRDDYAALAKPCGFLTKLPSKGAKNLMEKMLWQDK